MTEEEQKAALDAANAKTAELTKELEKLKAKDLNFRKLEQLTEAERGKLSDHEKELMQRQEALEAKSEELESNTLDFHRKNAISSVAGGDADTAKALEAAWNDISGDPTTAQGIAEKASKVYRLVKGQAPAYNQLAGSFASMGQAPSHEEKKKTYGDTPEGKNLADRLGFKLEVPKS